MSTAASDLTSVLDGQLAVLDAFFQQLAEVSDALFPQGLDGVEHLDRLLNVRETTLLRSAFCGMEAMWLPMKNAPGDARTLREPLRLMVHRDVPGDDWAELLSQQPLCAMTAPHSTGARSIDSCEKCICLDAKYAKSPAMVGSDTRYRPGATHLPSGYRIGIPPRGKPERSSAHAGGADGKTCLSDRARLQTVSICKSREPACICAL
ncbi:hypothetical protein [Janthinobacterium sp. RB2R34]|uniref:hypothetical protein n=1 Tax=Janthinobacterium sp. RB2R34 TaxID=3424193 RepID=UPI003F210C59